MFALGNAPKIRQYHLARFYVGERLGSRKVGNCKVDKC